jgi:hypothetical protein
MARFPTLGSLKLSSSVILARPRMARMQSLFIERISATRPGFQAHSEKKRAQEWSLAKVLFRFRNRWKPPIQTTHAVWNP